MFGRVMLRKTEARKTRTAFDLPVVSLVSVPAFLFACLFLRKYGMHVISFRMRGIYGIYNR